MSTRAIEPPSSIQQDTAQLGAERASYYVELPLEALDDQGSLLDSLIQFAFDTLHTQRLDLRIVAEVN